ncbi:MAG: glucuronate isomerase [Verrucomicrobia subdivision 3 bacterium]|nr:glucuronate isomerase [Limisphaerales bacterium]
MTQPRVDRDALTATVEKIVSSTPLIDIHTHLYDPAFGELLLWGIDDLLVYHYLVAESFRYFDMPYEKFWSLSKQAQAELIWDALFIRHSPVSEACRGVLATLNALGLDVRKRDLPAVRKWFQGWNVGDYITRCMELGGVQKICMTNSPFDDLERPVWERGFQRDPRFLAALRIDPLLVAWGDTAPILTKWGYGVGVSLTEKTISEVRRFLDHWTERIKAHYLMVSLGPEFDFPADTFAARLLEKAVLPHCRDNGLSMALMFGVKRRVNPQLRLAGDGVGLSKLSALENLCGRFPENKFLVTVLARENQHELCVLARKFRNLHVFGCWWFTNVPYVIEEMTRMRLELIGLSMTPQHSDARVLDQIIYKWQHSRRLIAKVLADKYVDLAQTGWDVTAEEIQRDVSNLFGGEFKRFCAGPCAELSYTKGHK